jgi:hypothetical protein
LRCEQEAAPVKLAGLPPLRPVELPLQTGTSDAAAVKPSVAAGSSSGGFHQSGSPAVTNDAAPGGSSLRNATTASVAASAAAAAQSAGDIVAAPPSRIPNGYTPSGLPDTFRRAGPVLMEAEAADQVPP